MIINLKKCKFCGLRGTFQNGSPGCTKFKIQVDPEKDFCSWQIPESGICKCSICNSNLPSKDAIIFTFEDKTLIACNQCEKLIGICQTCIYNSQCAFEADRTEPHFVMQTTRQGMMTMQSRVKNPKLVKKHCVNCRCSYGNNGDCCKESNDAACAKWQINPQLL